MLLLTIRLPKYIAKIPFLWSLIGYTASFLLGVKEDIALLLSGLIGFGIIMFKRQNSTKTEGDRTSNPT
jgi:uncharacterized oligopeptide transporter (OPT) family protein